MISIQELEEMKKNYPILLDRVETVLNLNCATYCKCIDDCKECIDKILKGEK